VLCWSSLAPATAMVGNPDDADPAVASVVTIVGSRGTFCSGAVIAPDLVMSAAHCTQPGAEYQIVLYDSRRQPQLHAVRRVASHPQFRIGDILAHRASADVALLQLAEPLSLTPLPIGAPAEPLAAGRRFTVAGVGVSRRGDGRTGGIVRSANLVATGQPGHLQIRLVDPATRNASPGKGACTGDSGAPMLEEQNQRAVVVGVVSWSTGAGNSEGCGGLTGVTPLSLYRGWVMQTMRNWGIRP